MAAAFEDCEDRNFLEKDGREEHEAVNAPRAYIVATVCYISADHAKRYVLNKNCCYCISSVCISIVDIHSRFSLREQIVSATPCDLRICACVRQIKPVVFR